MHSSLSTSSFSIGICATDPASNLSELLSVIEREQIPNGFSLENIIIVASSCPKEAVTSARCRAEKDSRIRIIEEAKRRGKADAINKIIQQALSEYLIFVNSDALPDKGSLSKLLFAIHRSEDIGMVSGCPTLEVSNNATSMVEQLMWTIHNECSLRLNHMHVSNHTTDEMMVVRSKILRNLPRGLVNDGAYIASRAKLEGYSIRFAAGAKVKIDVPARLVDLIRQRRRIIFGHFQVWKLTGTSPKTIETLLVFAPSVSLRIIVGALARFPKLITVFPIAIVGEIISTLLAVKDTVLSSKRHEVWKRYGN